MVNNQLYIKGSLASRKNIFEKKSVLTEFCRVARVTDQPGFAGFFLIPIFYLTRTGSAGRSGPRLVRV